MARLLVVADLVGLSLLLADMHDVVIDAQTDIESFEIHDASSVDAVVIGPRNPEQVMAAVDRLRTSGVTVPLLVVAGYQPAWAEVRSCAHPDVLIMHPPITKDPLLDSIATLLPDDPSSRRYRPPALPDLDTVPLPRPCLEPGEQPSPRERREGGHEVEAQDQPLPPRQPRAGDFLTRTPSTPPSPFPARASDGAPTGVPPARDSTSAWSTHTEADRREGDPDDRRRSPVSPPHRLPVAAYLTPPPPDPEGIPPRDHGTPAPPAGAASPVVAAPALERPHSPGDLVRLLIEHVETIYGVQDAAQALAEEVVERTDADAAVVLIPDGEVWRVSGGVGLRPVERRLVLEESHWLIERTISARHGVLVEDTDVIRAQLSGSPLAAWRHLMGVPLTAVRGLILLARGMEIPPFSDRDMTIVLQIANDSAGLFQDALRARELARLLAPLQDEQPSSGRVQVGVTP